MRARACGPKAAARSLPMETRPPIVLYERVRSREIRRWDAVAPYEDRTLCTRRSAAAAESRITSLSHVMTTATIGHHLQEGQGRQSATQSLPCARVACGACVIITCDTLALVSCPECKWSCWSCWRYTRTIPHAQPIRKGAGQTRGSLDPLVCAATCRGSLALTRPRFNRAPAGAGGHAVLRRGTQRRATQRGR